MPPTDSGSGNTPGTFPGLSTLGEVAREFSTHPWTYYSQLVLAAAKHQAMDTTFVTFPVTVVAGLLDSLAATEDLRALAGRIPQARFLQLNGTPFLPLQYPDRLQKELRALAARSDVHAPNELDTHREGACRGLVPEMLVAARTTGQDRSAAHPSS